MHVNCKKCGSKIAVAGRPAGSTTVGSNVSVQGPVNVQGGGISFGPGGGISFGPGGGIGFGAPTQSQFTCFTCGTTSAYSANEILD